MLCTLHALFVYYVCRTILSTFASLHENVILEQILMPRQLDAIRP